MHVVCHPTIPLPDYILDRNVCVRMSKAAKNWKQWETIQMSICCRICKEMAIFSYNRILQRQWYGSYFLKVGGVCTGVCFILPWRNLFNSSVPAPDQTSGGETPGDLELNWLHKQGDKKRTRARCSMGVFWNPHLGLPRMPSFPSQCPPVTASLVF